MKGKHLLPSNLGVCLIHLKSELNQVRFTHFAREGSLYVKERVLASLDTLRLNIEGRINGYL
jgi:hypothetical protein